MPNTQTYLIADKYQVDVIFDMNLVTLAIIAVVVFALMAFWKFA